MFTDPDTGKERNGILKVRYSHDAMIDLLIAEPSIKQNDLAAIFDRTPGWISQIVNSDSFQARLEERRSELIDPVLVSTIKERLNAVASVSLSRILDKLTSPLPATDDFLLESAKFATKALGYGARDPAGSTTNVAVVVQVPPKIPSATEWLTVHAPGSQIPS